FRIGNPEPQNGIYFYSHTVFGDRFLLFQINGPGSHVHRSSFIYKWNDPIQSRAFNCMKSTQSKNNCPFIFLGYTKANNNEQEHDGSGNNECHCYNFLNIKCSVLQAGNVVFSAVREMLLTICRGTLKIVTYGLFRLKDNVTFL